MQTKVCLKCHKAYICTADHWKAKGGGWPPLTPGRIVPGELLEDVCTDCYRPPAVRPTPGGKS